jgi:hypothetical protein
VTQILAEDGNEYLLLEASDWAALALDWAKNPGKLRKPARDGLIEFLAWFAAEGIYAQAYTILKRVYTREDDQRVQNWIMSRESGKPARAEWGWEVQEKDPRKPLRLLDKLRLPGPLRHGCGHHEGNLG